MQPCGDCRLCCKIFPVPVLQKAAGQWCRHTCAGGCAIHAQRPEICRQYDCYWRDHEELPESWRPDRIGVVATEAGRVTVGHCSLPVVIVQEDFAQASQGSAARQMLDHLLARGVAVMIIHGLDARIEFDPALYQSLSAEDIEAALRYELSQDAEELKRLGAVGEDYRALSREEAEAACRAERKDLERHQE